MPRTADTDTFEALRAALPRNIHSRRWQRQEVAALSSSVAQQMREWLIREGERERERRRRGEVRREADGSVAGLVLPDRWCRDPE